ncbi:lysoplasmalogenase [Paenibacillus sp. SAF-054]|uniref:lysoplasmalogenase n=1 Tax=unclassified Paenibacillus TaxID=185978 RepID=UPI003F818935
MIKRLLPAAILIMGLLYIFLLHSMVFKLIPMVLMLIYAYTLKPAVHRRYALLIGTGLFFCMLGDGLLHWFLIGLSAFLIGHLFYLSAFITRWTFSAVRMAALIPLCGFAAFMGWRLYEGLQSGGQANMTAPVFLYLTVITAMGFFAVMSRDFSASFGAMLFIASDSILAWNKFISDVPHSGILIMTTYYAAQFLIASSIKRGDSGLQTDNESSPGLQAP